MTFTHHCNPDFPNLSTRTVDVLMFEGVGNRQSLLSASRRPDFFYNLRLARDCNGQVMSEVKQYLKENR